MYEIYFDESGIHDTAQWTLISGFVTTRKTWDRIEDEWRKKLAEFKISYFHAVECENRRGVFSGLEREVRDALLLNLTEIICKYHLIAITSAIDPKAFKEILSDTALGKRFSNPYHFCFEHCLQQLSTWSSYNAQNAPVSVIVSKQDEYESIAANFYEYYRSTAKWGPFLGGFSILQSKNCVPLQVVDLLAYETYKYLVSKDKAKVIEYRPALKKMLEFDVSLFGGLYDAEAFRQLLKQKPMNIY